MTRLVSLMAATLVVVASFAIYGGTSAAHERRTVGPYEFEVGWLNEPAFAGLMNGLDLSVTDTRSDKGVEGLEKALTVDVQTGGLAPLALTIAARFGTPGAYDGRTPARELAVTRPPRPRRRARGSPPSSSPQDGRPGGRSVRGAAGRVRRAFGVSGPARRFDGYDGGAR